jgi:hypothetical protein
MYRKKLCRFFCARFSGVIYYRTLVSLTLTATRKHPFAINMVLFSKIDPKSITVEKVVQPENGNGTFVNLCYGVKREPLVFQTPMLSLSWPVQVREYKGKPGCVLPLSLGSPDDTTQKFKDWLNKVNEHLKDMAVKNSLAWYGKELTLEGINEEIFTDLVKKPKDPKYSESYIPKIDFDEDDYSNLKVEVFDARKQIINASENLCKGAKCAAIIKIRNMFLGKGIKRVSINNEVASVFCIPAPKESGFGFDIEADPAMVAACEAAEASPVKKAKKGAENGALALELVDGDDV